MAVTRTQYIRDLEERMAKGKSFDTAHKESVGASTVKSVKRKRSDQNEKLVKRVARKLYKTFYGTKAYEALYGKKAYAKKKFKPSKKMRK